MKSLIADILDKGHPVHIITIPGDHKNEDCWCNPRIENLDGNTIVWHEGEYENVS